MKKIIIRVVLVFLVAIMLLGIPIIAGRIANQFPNRTLDPDGSFWWISVHHIAQALLFIPFFLIAKRLNPQIDFNLRVGDSKKGWQYIWRFSVFFLVYTIIGYIIAFATDSFQPFKFDINANNVIGYLGFQLFLSGPSEELIFRAFAIGVIGFLIPGKLLKGKVSIANIIAALIFGLAHVSIFFSPFRLSYSLFQVIYAIALGLIYGYSYEKTKSVIYPMIMHSISNVIAVGATILVTVLVG
jgi:membrane protease YdiL (CAAX protease family)